MSKFIKTLPDFAARERLCYVWSHLHGAKDSTLVVVWLDSLRLRPIPTRRNKNKNTSMQIRILLPVHRRSGLHIPYIFV